MSEQPSLILCMDNALGEEVALRIEPDDDFHVFLSKAKSALGYEVDINSITNNQPVSLDDNIYHFLLNSEHCLTIDPETGQAYAPDNPDDLLYILDDGTQIKSSQIHFDNEDPVLDLTAVKIPFVKYKDDGDDEDNFEVQDVRNYNISGSPIPQWCNDGSTSRSSFAKSLPYRLVCNDTAAFNAQYSRYVEASNAKTYANLSNASSNKSPRSLIRDNFKKIDDRNPADDFTHLTREEVLNMFKNPPAVPNNNYCFNDKRRHVRKTDPSRPGYNCWTSNIITINGSLLCPTKSQNCFICGIFVEKDKFYLFDNEDQRLYRSPTSKRVTTQLKIICKDCLDKNFKPSNLKDPNQGLGPDEYVVIQNNQQYVFRKTGDFKCNIGQANEIINKIESQMSKQKKNKLDFIKLEISSDGEVTKLYDKDEVIEIKDEKDDSDVEIIEPVAEIDDTVIDNLENADEEVMQFLGKRQGDDANKELKCRFCERVFEDLEQVIKHGEEHKHDLDDGEVFPCPLCDYGYAKFLWLKGHLKAAHEKTNKEEEKVTDAQENNIGDVAEPDKEKPAAPAVAGSPTAASPIAQRTRSAAIKKQPEDNCSGESNEIQSAAVDNTGESNGAVPSLTLKAEVKQEVVDTSDEEAIWIVQATAEGTQPSKNVQDNQKSGETAKPTCHNCDQPLPPKGQPEHRCRKRGRKRKPKESDTVVYVPTHEDFIKRAQGRPGTGADCSDKILVDGKKKKTEPTSDPQIVTCHNCNESFTSKVRLKFHMQFHISNSEQTSGTYTCYRCHATMATESELFDHVHFQHHKQRRWQCPVVGCGKSFYLRATLTKHSRTHTDTRRYVCVTCGKKFLDKQTLDEHGVTHLQIKPFQCHICMKQLTRRSRLRMHLRAHEEELRPVLLLVCAHCKRAFRDQRDAEEHATKSSECIEAFTSTLKQETEENCLQLLSPTSGLVRPINEEDGSKQACGPPDGKQSPQPMDACNARGIANKDDISDAIPREVRDARAAPLLAPLLDAARPLLRVVEIDKAFRCEYCEDVFYLDEGLNKHRHIHKGVKNPFICHICKVNFATYSRCTTHKTTHGFYKRSLEDAKRLALNPGPPAPGGASAIGILGYGGFPVVKHFLCEDCGRSYLHWTYLQVHRRMKHNNDNYIFKCNYCMLTFPNVWSVTYHRKKVHGKTGHDDRDGGVSKVLKEDHRIPCRDCDQVLPNKTALYKHRKKEHSDMTLMENSEDCDSAEARPRRRYNNHTSYSRRPTPSSSRVKLKNELKNARKHPVDITVIELEGLNPSTEEMINGLSRNNIALDKVFEISKMSFPKGSRNTIPSCGRALAALGHVPAESVHLSLAPHHKEYNVTVSNPRGITTTATRPTILQRTQYNSAFIQ